jgi:hypothetical protein
MSREVLLPGKVKRSARLLVRAPFSLKTRIRRQDILFWRLIKIKRLRLGGGSATITDGDNFDHANLSPLWKAQNIT